MCVKGAMTQDGRGLRHSNRLPRVSDGEALTPSALSGSRRSALNRP